MDASGLSQNYPLLTSHEKALWKDPVADAVSLGSFDHSFILNTSC